MDETAKNAAKGFATAALLLPESLSRAAFGLSPAEQRDCEELRVRLNRPMTAKIGGDTRVLRQGGAPVLATRADIDAIIDRVTGSSAHAYMNQMAEGFLTARDGHRLGICGTLTTGAAGPVMRDIASINLRIAKQFPGLGDDLCQRLYGDGFRSTLILAPPGAGKTTLLRDMARRLSYDYAVAVVDSRFEIAACRGGVPYFDLGRCDILSGAAKADGLTALTRAMGPEIIALDEITDPRDVTAMADAAYCGCGFLASAHGADIADLRRRPAYRRLMDSGIFETIIVIARQGGVRRYRVWRKGAGYDDQDAGAGADCGVVLGHGAADARGAAPPEPGAGQLYPGAANHQGGDCLSGHAAAGHS
jgi:stage III sporulation protein AA